MGAPRLAAYCSLLGATLACGTNKPELPPGLERPEHCVAVGYPDGPYGTEPGAVIRNACFSGFRAPHRVAHTPEGLEPIALSDYHDPEGDAVRLLVLNTAALWCAACRIEHESLPRYLEPLRPRGLVFLSAVFQDERHEPADFDDLVLWIETFDTRFPIVLDPGYSFGLYASAETAPLNLVVDPKTMTILAKFVGDQPAVMWPFVEAELAKRSAP
ncbi:MAG: hypothetical protein DIU78_021865 [Pseudomonadota bacterium]|nr:MAG: hypothetical protein DIU78_20770 [Pseudomonadota bacterium]